MGTVTYRKMPKDKSVGAALVLTFFFGPFGLFYSAAWWGALLMLLGAIVSGVFTMGIGAGLFWAASMIWGAIAASNKHSRYGAWLATQPQTFVAQQPQGGPRYLPLAPASAQLPSSSGDAAQGLEGSPVGASHSGPVAERSAREEAALRELKRLCDLGLITEQEASAKKAEILSRILASSPDDEATVAEEQTASDDASSEDDSPAPPSAPVDIQSESVAEPDHGEVVACNRAPVLATATEPVGLNEAESAATYPAERRGQQRLLGIVFTITIVACLAAGAAVVASWHGGSATASRDEAAAPITTPRPGTTGLATMPTGGPGYGAVRFLDPQKPDLSIIVEIVGVAQMNANDYPANSPGQWYAGIHFRISNVGRKPYAGSLADRIVMFDNHWKQSGRRVETDAQGASLPNVLQSISLTPGRSTSGWIYYEMVQNRSPVEVVFSPTGFDEAGLWFVQ